MAQGTCSTDGCGRVEQLRRGMCQRCYVRWKKCATCLAMKPPAEPCTIGGCEEPQLARGWCRMHYLRWWRTGTTDDPAPFVPKPCGHPGCPQPAVKLGLCVKHHARWKKRGTTDDPPPKPLRCAVDGCDRAPRSRGWCKRHYKVLTGQGSAHEMKRYALKLGSQVESVSYERLIELHGMVCHLCGGEIESRRDLNMDHVIPLARGGPHTYANIRPSHGRCNRRKHAKLMSELILSGVE